MLRCCPVSCCNGVHGSHYGFKLSAGIFLCVRIPLFEDYRIAFVHGVSGEPYFSLFASNNMIKVLLLNFLSNSHVQSLFI